MERESNIRVVEFWQKNIYDYFAKLLRDGRIDDERDVQVKNSRRSILGAFILNNGKRVLNNFVLYLRLMDVKMINFISHTLIHFT